jgi:tetratricopeptide (TPR) repeat protein
MTVNPKTDSILDEANRLFLKGNLKEAISYYDQILNEHPNHIGSLNNKGYALSKLKDYDGAIQCYDCALGISPTDLSVLVNKISALRKKGELTQALNYCDNILESNSKYNIVLYHKERILFSMKQFEESILCCNIILDNYPNNADVLFDKSCNLAMLSRSDDALDTLEDAISHGTQYKIKAKKTKSFEKLMTNTRFQKLTS